MKSAAIAILCLLLAGCHLTVPSTPSTTAPVAAALDQTYSDANAGITFQYPPTWKSTAQTKTQFKATASDGSQFTLDVPVLPFHIPGMIPVGQVESGYVDDLKKRMPDLLATRLPDPAVPSATQRRVKLAGHQNGKPAIDEAALIVHNDKVYILAIDTDEKGYDPMHAALDAILSSLRWTK